MSVPGNPAARLYSERLWRTDRKGDEDLPLWHLQREGDYFVAEAVHPARAPREEHGRRVPARKTVCG